MRLNRLLTAFIIAGVLWLIVAAVWAVHLLQRYASVLAG